MSCKVCGSNKHHDTLHACVRFLEAEIKRQNRAEHRLVNEIASLRAELEVARKPLPRESSDVLRVMQALENRVQVLEAEFRAHVSHKVRSGAIKGAPKGFIVYCRICGGGLADTQFILDGHPVCRGCYMGAGYAMGGS